MLCIFCSCKTKKFATPEEATKINSITLSNGGGFSGRYTKYIILENGQIFKSNGIVDEYKSLPSLKKSIAKEIFKKYRDLSIADDDTIESGNMTYSIAFKDKKGEVKKQKWVDDTEHKKLGVFFNYTMSQIAPKTKKTFPKPNTSTIKAEIR